MHAFEKGRGCPVYLEAWVHGRVALGPWSVKGAAGTASAGMAHPGFALLR